MFRFSLCVAALVISIAATANSQEPGIPCGACDSACEPACGGGLIGGVEILALRPYASDPEQLSISAGGDTFSLSLPDNSFDIAPRFWLGYVGPEGLGVRGRYFQFDHNLDAETLVVEADADTPFFGEGRFTSSGQLDIYAADVEAFQQINLNRWNVRLGGGLRAGGVGRVFSFGVQELDEPPSRSELSKKFDGVGPTIFGEFRRPIGGRGIALVANARGSVLFGSERLRIANIGFGLLGDELSEKHDAIVGVGEIQLGAEWNRPLARGGNLFVSALWEGQVWSGSGAILDVISNDIGLMGVSFGAGITR